MKIKPFLSAGEVIVHADGMSFDVVPMQVFRLRGGVAFRIGRNLFSFDKDGRYDGPEFRINDKNMGVQLRFALEACKDTRGRRPDTSHFMPGTPGYDAETKLWPEEGEEPPNPEGQQSYGICVEEKN